MPSTYTDKLGLELQETGEGLNAWGLRLNNALTLVDDAIAGIAPIALTGNYSLTNTLNMINEARKPILLFTDGGLNAAPTVTLPPVQRLRYVENRGATYAITFTTGGVAGVLPPGRKALVLCNGTDVSVVDWVAATDDARIAAQAARDLAQAWASLLGTQVAGIDYSAREYAVGGTVPVGSAKLWSTKTGATVDGTEYSAREYASGNVAPSGSARLWSLKTGSAVSGTDYSAREHAVGTAVPAGSAQQWATKTGGAVALSEFSAKEYAQGAPTLGSARAWSVTLGSAVAGGEYASKEYAIGDLTATGGSAKAWALDTVSPNGTTEKSAKSYAGDSATSATLSQAWAANPENVVVTGGLYSALHYAAKAAASAAAAATFDPSSYVPKTGNVTLTGPLYPAVEDLGTVSSGTATINLATQAKKRLQIGGAITIAISNKPAASWTVEIELVNGGAFTLTWPTVSWLVGDGTTSTTFAAMGVALQAAATNTVILWATGTGTVYGRAG